MVLLFCNVFTRTLTLKHAALVFISLNHPLLMTLSTLIFSYALQDFGPLRFHYGQSYPKYSLVKAKQKSLQLMFNVHCIYKAHINTSNADHSAVYEAMQNNNTITFKFYIITAHKHK